MRFLTLAYGIVGCVIVLGATARFGYLTSDNKLDGLISAALFTFVGAFGLAGHAAAVRLWPRSRLGAILVGLIAIFSMLVSLTNSLGFVVLRGSKGQEAAADTNRSIASAKVEIARLQAQRDALPHFAPTTAAQVRTARDAVATATAARQAECSKASGGVGENCRLRTTAEGTAIDRLTVTEANLAATAAAAVLDTRITAARQVMARAGGERIENQHGKALAALATLLWLPTTDANAAVTLQQAVLALLLELSIAAAFATSELLRPVPAPLNGGPLKIEAIAEPIEAAKVEQMNIETLPPPKLVASTDVPIGSPKRFFREAIDHATGTSLSMAIMLDAYRSWCHERHLQPVSAADFATDVLAICEAAEISTRITSSSVILRGVMLTKSTKLAVIT